MAFQPVQFPITGPHVVQANVIQQQDPRDNTNIWNQAIAGIGAGLAKGLGGMVSEAINPDPQHAYYEELTKEGQYKREHATQEEMGFYQQLAANGDQQAQAKLAAMQAANPDMDTALAYNPEQSFKADFVATQRQMLSPEFRDLTPEEQMEVQARTMKIGNTANILQQWKLGQQPTEDQLNLAASNMKEALSLHQSMYLAKTGGKDTTTLAALADPELITNLMQAKEKMASADPVIKQQGISDYQSIINSAKKMYPDWSVLAADQSAQQHLATGLGTSAALASLKKMQEDLVTSEQNRSIQGQTFEHLKGLWGYDSQFKEAELRRLALGNQQMEKAIDLAGTLLPYQAEQARLMVETMKSDAILKPAKGYAELASLYATVNYQKTASSIALDNAARQIAKDQLGMGTAEATEATKRMVAASQMLNGLAKAEQEKQERLLQLQMAQAAKKDVSAAMASIAESEEMLKAYRAGLKNLVDLNNSATPITQERYMQLFQAAKQQLGPGDILNAYDPATGEVDNRGLQINGVYADSKFAQVINTINVSRPKSSIEELKQEKIPLPGGKSMPLPQYLQQLGYSWDNFAKALGRGNNPSTPRSTR